ncbi:unknown [Bacteroides sp. CAG:709]|nr:unknown [Bacteroides sp. CAG:709]
MRTWADGFGEDAVCGGTGARTEPPDGSTGGRHWPGQGRSGDSFGRFAAGLSRDGHRHGEGFERVRGDSVSSHRHRGCGYEVRPVSISAGVRAGVQGYPQPWRHPYIVRRLRTLPRSGDLRLFDTGCSAESGAEGRAGGKND